MIYRIKHLTKLAYAAPVANARFNLRLTPRPWGTDVVRDQTVAISPEPDTRVHQAGPYWVNATQIGFTTPLEQLEIASEFTIQTSEREAIHNSPDIAQVRIDALEDRDLSDRSPAPYLFASRIAAMNEAIAGWGVGHLSGKSDILGSVDALTEAVFREFNYAPGATDSRTPPETAFAERKGVCQDFAHVMIIALRSFGIPAAYVSGYLRTLPPPGKEKLVGADAMHAWVNVWCGNELGWIGFDPTNNCRAGEDHIPIGMGRDYADVSPVDGTFIGTAPQRMTTAVDVVALE